jgi:hypothetical protein
MPLSPGVVNWSGGNSSSPKSPFIKPEPSPANSEDDEEDDLDLMPDDHRDLLLVPEDERDQADIEGITELLLHYVPKFAANMNTEGLAVVASCCKYQFCRPFEVVCDQFDKPAYYFLVLMGSVDIDERTLHHQEDVSSFRKD